MLPPQPSLTATKPAFLYYFGDYDPSGVDIPRVTEARLREFAPRAEIHFERIAVTPAQIKAMSLPTRPTKKTDSRSKTFVGESVEVDAVSPELRRLVRDSIMQHIDERQLHASRLVEEQERQTLRRIARNLPTA